MKKLFVNFSGLVFIFLLTACGGTVAEKTVSAFEDALEDIKTSEHFYDLTENQQVKLAKKMHDAAKEFQDEYKRLSEAKKKFIEEYKDLVKNSEYSEVLIILDPEEILKLAKEKSLDIEESDLEDLLKSYEEFINEYGKLVKAVNAGDSDAASKSYSLIEKAEELEKKLEKNKKAMTSKQQQKFSQLQYKLLALVR